MNYVLVEDGVVVNIIVAEPLVAAELGAREGYDGCVIGGKYEPPLPESAPMENDAMVAAVVDLMYELDTMKLRMGGTTV